MLRKRPVNMLSDHGAGRPSSGAQRSKQLRRTLGVPQTYRQITQPALIANSPDRRTFSALHKFLLAPHKQIQQCGAVERVSG